MTMLTAIDRKSRLNVQTLGGGVLLLVWEADISASPRRFRPVIGGVPARPPFTHAAEPIAGHRERHFLAVRSSAAGPEPISVEALGSDGVVSVVAATTSIIGGDLADLDPGQLIGGVDEGGRLRIARLLLETIGTLFKLGGDATFATACRALFNELFDRPGALAVRCGILDHAVLVEGALPRGFTGRLRAVCVGAKGVRLLPPASVVTPLRSARDERNPVALVLPPAFAGPGTAVYLIGESGLHGRLVNAPAASAVPEASEWLQSEAAASSPLRSVLLDAVARLAMTDATAAALATELRAIAQHGPIGLNEASSPLAAGVDLVAAGDCGLFVSGWLRDDNALVEAIEVERLQQETVVPVASLPRFSHRIAGDEVVTTANLDGFALSLAATPDVALATCRLALRLKSGTRLLVWEGQPQAASDGVRDRVLASVPLDDGGEAAIAQAVVPWVRSYQDPRAATVSAHQFTAFGRETEKPEFSLVIPLINDGQLLRCTIAALAVDRTLAMGEFIFVTGQSARRPVAERLLKDLLATYGLAARLVVLAPATGGGSLLNAGALLARSQLIAFLGSGILPERPGWLPRLTQILKGDSKRGLIGAQIVAEDSSLRMAGADLHVDERGIEVRRRMQGFPRDFRPERTPPPARIVSSNAMVIRRSVFDQSGGFDDRYLTPLYRDADLCLEVQRLGSGVIAVVEPTFVDLGGPTIADAAPAAAAGAVAVDRSLFNHRWHELVTSEDPDAVFAAAPCSQADDAAQSREAA